MVLISSFRYHLQCFPLFAPSGAYKSCQVICFQFLKSKILCSRDTTSLLLKGQPTNSADAGGLYQCTCRNTVCRARHSMLSLQPKRLEWDSPQLISDIYKRLNELSSASAHLSPLTLKGNLGIYPGCKRLQHKNLKLGERNLILDSSQ